MPGSTNCSATAGSRPERQALVHGAMFTRGPSRSQAHGDLRRRLGRRGRRDAVSQPVAEDVLRPVPRLGHAGLQRRQHDGRRGGPLPGRAWGPSGVTAAVLAATGPVGQRVAELLAAQGADVAARLTNAGPAEQTCRAIAGGQANARLTPRAVRTEAGLGVGLPQYSTCRRGRCGGCGTALRREAKIYSVA